MASAWMVARFTLRPEESENIARQELVARSVARLSPAPVGVPNLAFLEELTYEESAGRPYLPFGTVKSRLSSALAKLRGKEGP